MRKDLSSYNFIDFKNLKITYLFGAGASYNAVPIWKGQGQSMKDVAEYILGYIDDKILLEKERTKIVHRNPILTNLAVKIKKYGEFAIEFGSIDIYAKRLHLLGDENQLNELKYCLSIYFDLWENYVSENRKLDDKAKFSKIDKRYLSLLSVLLEKGLDKSYPKLHKNISFITWNYDLQLEMAYESFMGIQALSLDCVNDGFKFLSDSADNKKTDVIHLNGFRGNFYNKGKLQDNVPNLIHGDLNNYLINIINEKTDFKNRNYKNSIKYAWEEESKVIDDALKIMKNTDILVIIGYSFPSFNRKLDAELINEFQAENNYIDIILQDPNPNSDILNVLFNKPENVEVKSNLSQFYIPHEFLFPPENLKLEDFVS